MLVERDGNYLQSEVGNLFLAAKTVKRLGKDDIISVVRYQEISFDIKYRLRAYRASILDC